MPVRPREMNDQPTDARIRQVIRHILNQEVRRLLNASTSLSATVATNTSNISANASAIAQNVIDIDNLDRRRAARNNEGIISSLGLAAGSGGVSVSSTAFSGQQTWTLTVPSHPIEVTLWKKQTFTADAQFDTFQFNAVQFDEGELIQAVDVSTQPTYTPSSGLFSVDWGTAKTGTIYLLKFGGGRSYGIVAVAD